MGGRGALSMPAAGEASSQSAEPAPAPKHKKQRVEAPGLDDRELVGRAVKLRSCEASGVTLHTLREVLRVLPAEIVSLAPAVRDSPNSCSHTELASLLCFGPGDPAQLLTELKIAWDAVKEPRPQYDQLQMRAAQWLWLWVRGCGVTNLGRLADLVRATRLVDPVARAAPPNAPGKREKRPKEAWGQLERIPEEAPGVLAGTSSIAEVQISEAEIEIETEVEDARPAESARPEAAADPELKEIQIEAEIESATGRKSAPNEAVAPKQQEERASKEMEGAEDEGEAEAAGAEERTATRRRAKPAEKKQAYPHPDPNPIPARTRTRTLTLSLTLTRRRRGRTAEMRKHLRRAAGLRCTGVRGV